MANFKVGESQIDFRNVIIDENQNVRTESYNGPTGPDGKAINGDESIRSLADSIKRTGLINPISVCDCGKGKYKVIAGFRRALALKMLMDERKGKDKDLPFTINVVIVRSDMTPYEVMTYQNQENLKRTDLTPAEVAKSITKMIAACGVSDESKAVTKVANDLNKSRSYVANLNACINKLIPPALDRWLNGVPRLSMPDAVALCWKSPEEQAAKWNEWIESGHIKDAAKVTTTPGSTTTTNPQREKSGPSKDRRESALKLATEESSKEQDKTRESYYRGVVDTLKWIDGGMDEIPGLPGTGPKVKLTKEQRKAKAKAEKDARDAAKLAAYQEVERLKAERDKLMKEIQAAKDAADAKLKGGHKS